MTFYSPKLRNNILTESKNWRWYAGVFVFL